MPCCAWSLQSCPTMQPHGPQPARLLCPQDSPYKNTGGLPCPPPEELPDPGIKQTCVSCIARGFFTTEPLGKPIILKYETLIKQVLGEGKPIVTFQWKKKSSSVNILSISKKLNNDIIITFFTLHLCCYCLRAFLILQYILMLKLYSPKKNSSSK